MREAAVGIERRLVAETFWHAVQARQLGHLAAPHEETRPLQEDERGSSGNRAQACR